MKFKKVNIRIMTSNVTEKLIKTVPEQASKFVTHNPITGDSHLAGVDCEGLVNEEPFLEQSHFISPRQSLIFQFKKN